MTPYVSHVSQLKLRVRDFLGRATAKVLVKWSNEDISEATWEFFFDWSRSFLISTIRSWLFRRGRFDGCDAKLKERSRFKYEEYWHLKEADFHTFLLSNNC